MSVVVAAPPIIWLLGYTFRSQGPDGIGEWVSVMSRLILAGLVICLVYSAVSLGAASLTDRRAFASIAVIFVLLGPSIAVNVLIEAADASTTYRLLDPLAVPLEIAPRLFGDRTPEFGDIGTPAVIAANLAWFGAGLGTIIARYRKLGAV